MLADKCPAVDGDNVIVRHGRRNNLLCEHVLHRLSVNRKQYGTVYDEEIGVSCRQAVSVLRIEDGVGQWQLYEMERPAVGSP